MEQRELQLQLNKRPKLELVLLGQLYLDPKYKALEEHIDNLIVLAHKKCADYVQKGDMMQAMQSVGKISALQHLKNSVKLIHDQTIKGKKVTPETMEDYPDGIPIEI